MACAGSSSVSCFISARRGSGAVFCSQNDMTLHFGLGAATKIDKLEIQWPDGSTEVFPVTSVDKTITITQGKGAKP